MSRQAWDASDCLVERGRWSSGGEGGSYIAFDQTGRYFAVANAKTGWAVFRNGEEPELIAQLGNEGSGPHPRQAKSHPHCVIFSPDNRWIVASDMGADEVLAFPFDAETGAIGQKILAYRARSGSGPRHILFHRGAAYLLNELGNTLVVLRPGENGVFAELQIVETLPADFAGESHTAHLAVGPSANLLLASNRGHDSIATFVLAEDGLVSERQWSASGGKWPWFFAVTETGALLVANTLSDRISSLEFDGVGSFAETGTSAVRSPVFLAQF
jgi:6-phosphogluconolactonase